MGSSKLAAAALAALSVQYAEMASAKTADAKSPRLGFTLMLSRLMPMQIGDQAPQPSGQVEYCARHAWDCAWRSNPDRLFLIDAEKFAELQKVNTGVNSSLEQVEDVDQYGVKEHWTYPVSGWGDCEDYVLEKRRLLINKGWPAYALLITIVSYRYEDGSSKGHAVLTVRTNLGDLVMDLTGNVMPWQDYPHQFIQRQSPASAVEWEWVIDQFPVASAETTKIE